MYYIVEYYRIVVIITLFILYSYVLLNYISDMKVYCMTFYYYMYDSVLSNTHLLYLSAIHCVTSNFHIIMQE